MREEGKVHLGCNCTDHWVSRNWGMRAKGPHFLTLKSWTREHEDQSEGRKQIEEREEQFEEGVEQIEEREEREEERAEEEQQNSKMTMKQKTKC